MDAIILGSALAAGNHAIGMLRSAADGLKSSGKVEVIGQLIDAQLAMMELLQEHQKIVDEKNKLLEQVRQLEEKLKFQSTLVYDDKFYFLQGDSVPYCPQCWEASKKAIHLQGPANIHREWTTWTCLNCMKEFNKPR